MRAGLSGYSPSCSLSCGSGMQPRSAPNRVRKQKTDRQDAELLLRLLIEDRFPRIWVADEENRDLRQLLWHRHRLVQMRTRIMNQLHVLALNEGGGVRRRCGDRRGGGNLSWWGCGGGAGCGW